MGRLGLDAELVNDLRQGGARQHICFQRVRAEPLTVGLKRLIALVGVRVRVRVRFRLRVRVRVRVRARLGLFIALMATLGPHGGKRGGKAAGGTGPGWAGHRVGKGQGAGQGRLGQHPDPEAAYLQLLDGRLIEEARARAVAKAQRAALVGGRVKGEDDRLGRVGGGEVRAEEHRCNEASGWEAAFAAGARRAWWQRGARRWD